VDAVAASLDATATRLGELVARERAFSADASHQLRTPLTALRVELETLELRDELAEVAAALREVERLEGTIATLLAVARDAPRGAATADLSAVLEELDRDWRPRLGRLARPLRIAVRVPDATVRASADVVREILGVLVDNALEHGRGAVDVVVRPAGRFVAVDVTDEGPGVDADAGDVFARRGGGGPGHGIGLALARSLAHAEGGRLALARIGSRPTFTLTLPAATDGERED
jgi:signal transduction histidine kinase